MITIKSKRRVIALLLIMQFGAAAHGVTYFRVIEGTPYLPVFTNATRPNPAVAGMLIYNSDTDAPEICTADGAPGTWADLCGATTAAPVNAGYFTVVNGLPIIPIKAGDPAGAPSSGSVYFQNGSGKIQVHNGSAWADFDLFSGLIDNPGFSTGSSTLDVFKIPVLEANPLTPAETGGIYFNSTDDKLRYCKNDGWWVSEYCGSPPLSPPDPDAFVTRWEIPGGDLTVVFPTSSSGTLTYSGTINWGDPDDPVVLPFDSYNHANFTHTYTGAGTYDVTITGTFERLHTRSAPGNDDKDKLTKVIQWGDVGFTTFGESFFGCTNLLSLPADTPITGVVDSASLSFVNMFNGCTKLEQIPRGLFDNCTLSTDFRYAFDGCGGLGDIPANLFDLQTNAPSFMYTFRNTSITAIPDGLFVKNKKVTNFGGVFYNCDKLKSIPASLFETDAATAPSFANAFAYCDKLEAIPPGLFDLCAKATNFSSVFHTCPRITAIPPNLFDSHPDVTNFSGAFRSTAVAVIPDDLFKYNTKVTSFSAVFLGCDITSIPAPPIGLFDTSGVAAGTGTSFSYVFSNCSGLTSIPDDLFNECKNANSFQKAFMGTAITSIPDGLFDEHPDVTSFSDAFSGTDISAIPDDLFVNNKKVTSFATVFYNCDKLTSIPTPPAGLFDTTGVAAGTGTSFAGAFGNCAILTAIPDDLFDLCTNATNFGAAFRDTPITAIPDDLFANNKKVTSFSQVFFNCDITSIHKDLFDTSGVTLPDKTSFQYAFYGCTSLTVIPPNLFTTTNCPSVSSFQYCFKNCTGLDGTDAPELWLTYTNAAFPALNPAECFEGAGPFTNSADIDNPAGPGGGWTTQYAWGNAIDLP